MQCKKCDSPNRETARYCKFCGNEINGLSGNVQNFDLDELTGLSDLKEQFTSVELQQQAMLWR